MVYTLNTLLARLGGQLPVLSSGDRWSGGEMVLQEELTERLLQYTPRRLSRRGTRIE